MDQPDPAIAPVTTPPTEPHEAAEPDVSLHASLRGYEPPPAGADELAVEKRLCLGCNSVQEFVNGRCQNCGYRIGESKPFGSEITFAPDVPAGASMATKIVVIVLIVILLGVAAYFVLPLFNKPAPTATSDAQTATEASSARETGANAPPGTKPGSFIGGVQTVAVDDALTAKLKSAFTDGNAAWTKAGTAAYVYRFGVDDHTDAAVSQTLDIRAYVGGKDAHAAASGDKTKPLQDALDAELKDLNSHPGVTARLVLSASEGEETPNEKDTYIVYGYEYGQEHMHDMKPVLSALEDYKTANHQYPLSLLTAKEGIRSKGNPFYLANGYGYIPVFRTDPSGNIVMGTGSAMQRYTPAEVTGYYLFPFLADPNDGLDLFNAADLLYYRERISPFPYAPTGPVHNMPLHKDGKPDGIGAVVLNGKLQGAP